MISVKQLAEYFENGLNKTLGNPEIQFKIWADAGEYKKPERDGNVITHYILGNLRTSTSANDATDLVMGVNGLSLDFKIPVQAPKTNATQTAAELQKIQDGQYPFLTYITNAINSYFQKAQAFSLTDESGTEYSVAFQAGTAVTGNAEIAARHGQSVDFNVYIEVYFIQDGINSKDVKIYFDGESVPYQALRTSRAAQLEREVTAGDLNSKNLATTTAFSLDFEFPANSDKATSETFNYLINGDPNTAHFIEVQLATTSKLYFMMNNTINTSAEGVSIAGITVALIEIMDFATAVNVPEYFQVGRFEFDNSDINSLSFTLAEECNTFISGVGALNRSGPQTVALTSRSFKYNDETGKYFVTLITDKTVTITNSSAPFTVVSGVSNG